MGVNATEIFAYAGDTVLTLAQLRAAYGPDVAWWWLSNVEYITVDSQHFLAEWTFSKDADGDSAEGYAPGDDMTATEEYYAGHAMYYQSAMWLSQVQVSGILGDGTGAADSNVSWYVSWVNDGGEPVFRATTLTEENSVLTITLNSDEVQQLVSLNTIEPLDLSAVLDASVTALAEEIIGLNVSSQATFKNISAPTLANSLSIFESEEAETTQTVVVSTVTTY